MKEWLKQIPLHLPWGTSGHDRRVFWTQHFQGKLQQVKSLFTAQPNAAALACNLELQLRRLKIRLVLSF